MTQASQIGQENAQAARSAVAPDNAPNADPKELAHFNQLAQRWWDPEGPSKALLAINPVRLGFIQQELAKTGRSLANLRVLDLGCGGGILSEALAREGAKVTAIDLSEELLEVAKLHSLGEALTIDYRMQSVESLQAQFEADNTAKFDLICCMEMLEHVPDPVAILRAAKALLSDSGIIVLSTLDRTPKAFALGIIAAEYVLNLVPRGTHRYGQFIRPHELARALRGVNLQVQALQGLDYQPLSNRAVLREQISVNYLLAASA